MKNHAHLPSLQAMPLHWTPHSHRPGALRLRVALVVHQALVVVRVPGLMPVLVMVLTLVLTLVLALALASVRFMLRVAVLLLSVLVVTAAMAQERVLVRAVHCLAPTLHR